MLRRLFRYWNLISIAVLLVSAIWIQLSASPKGMATEITAPQAGFHSPPFSLSTLDGSLVDISTLQGKPVLINFWASWCPPCKSEMPGMQRMYEAYRERGIEILAINTAYQDRRADAEQFVQENGLTFPILIDETGQVSQDYRIQALPTSFFIDSDGLIREVVVGGPMSEGLLRSQMEQLLGGLP